MLYIGAAFNLLVVLIQITLNGDFNNIPAYLNKPLQKETFKRNKNRPKKTLGCPNFSRRSGQCICMSISQKWLEPCKIPASIPVSVNTI